MHHMCVVNSETDFENKNATTKQKKYPDLSTFMFLPVIKKDRIS